MFTERKIRRPLIDVAGVVAAVFLTPTAWAQIDPVRRDLVEAGYSRPLGGSPPVAAYAYYYMNRPEFLRPNLAFRLVATPLYVDGELGMRGAFGPGTDLTIGLSGGGFAYSYQEIQQGEWLRDQSFTGHGGTASFGLIHLFNPGATIPFSGMLPRRLLLRFVGSQERQPGRLRASPESARGHSAGRSPFRRRGTPARPGFRHGAIGLV